MAATLEAAPLVNPINSTDQKILNDPYPMLKRLRTESPVYWSKSDKYWLISRHCDVTAILQDPEFEKQIQTWKHAPNPILISLIPHVKSLSKVASNWLLNLNPPQHTRVRSLLNRAFTAPVLQSLRPVINSIAQDLLERMDGRTEMNLMADYAIPLPMRVIGHMLGVPDTREGELKNWSTKLAAIAGRHRNLQVVREAGRAVEEMTQYLKPAIDERREHPKDDLLSVLVQAEMEGTRLKTEELVANCILLIVAGYETTTNLIGNTFVCLLRSPQQLEQLRAQPELVQATISEVLRFESPAQTAPRLASKSKVIGGKTIKAGDLCWLLLGSANRDEEAFDNPDKFDISRPPSNKNLAFGAGMHRCVGATLAEVELDIAVKSFVDWKKEFALADQQIDYKIPFALRGPNEVILKLS